MAELDMPRVGQIVNATSSGGDVPYRVTSVEPGDKGCWTYTLEPVTDEPDKRVGLVHTD